MYPGIWARAGGCPTGMLWGGEHLPSHVLLLSHGQGPVPCPWGTEDPCFVPLYITPDPGSFPPPSNLPFSCCKCSKGEVLGMGAGGWGQRPPSPATVPHSSLERLLAGQLEKQILHNHRPLYLTPARSSIYQPRGGGWGASVRGQQNAKGAREAFESMGSERHGRWEGGTWH